MRGRWVKFGHWVVSQVLDVGLGNKTESLYLPSASNLIILV